MNWIIYNLITITKLSTSVLILLLFVLVVPIIISLFILGMLLSFLRDQRQKFAPNKSQPSAEHLSVLELLVNKCNHIILCISKVSNIQISQMFERAPHINFRPILSRAHSPKVNAGDTLVPRSRHS